MASSKVGLANRALTKIGSARITSLDEDSKAAATINSMWDYVLDAALRAHVWAFAKTRATLPALSTAPAFGYAYQYKLPSDFLRLLRIGTFLVYPRPCGEGIYSIEGGNILTNLDAPLPIRYIKRITDPNLFDSLFAEAFACRLAAESCEAITQSATKKQAAWAEHDRAISDAIRVNAIERPAQAIGDDTWIEARHSRAVFAETPIIRS